VEEGCFCANEALVDMMIGESEDSTSSFFSSCGDDIDKPIGTDRSISPSYSAMPLRMKMPYVFVAVVEVVAYAISTRPIAAVRRSMFVGDDVVVDVYFHSEANPPDKLSDCFRDVLKSLPPAMRIDVKLFPVRDGSSKKMHGKCSIYICR